MAQAMPILEILLVMVGIVCLVLELKAPGHMLPGVIAAICFILFFWFESQRDGQLIYSAIALFLVGLALVGFEILLIPGHGAGVLGGLLILAGLTLAGIDRIPESGDEWTDLLGRSLRYGLTIVAAGILAFNLSRYLPEIPYANRLILTPLCDKPEENAVCELPGGAVAAMLLGEVGTATSLLGFAGRAKFTDRYVDVVTEGEFIPPGASVQVIEVEGTRIVVKRV